MNIIIFIAALALLILVHEAGHFFVAKWSGMRVDEFGLGFPPRAATYEPEGSETTYSLNWLPIGGFVKIFGEDLEDIDSDHPDKDRSFSSKSTGKQVAVLVAGVVMNMILAYLLLSLSFMIGKVVMQDNESQPLSDKRVIITQVLPDSPAASAGLEPGSRLTELQVGTNTLSGEDITPDEIQDMVSQATSSPVAVTASMGGRTNRATVTPETTEEGDRQIGIAMAEVGTLTLGPLDALKRGAQATVNITEQTLAGFYGLLQDAVSGSTERLSQVAGPVGIADFVGDAADRGTAPLFSFVALISINLAILNLLPVPALDGGRIVFSLIEEVRRKPIPPRVAQIVNGVGMALLLLLMILVTYQDILRLL